MLVFSRLCVSLHIFLFRGLICCFWDKRCHNSDFIFIQLCVCISCNKYRPIFFYPWVIFLGMFMMNPRFTFQPSFDRYRLMALHFFQTDSLPAVFSCQCDFFFWYNYNSSIGLWHLLGSASLIIIASKYSVGKVFLYNIFFTRESWVGTSAVLSILVGLKNNVCPKTQDRTFELKVEHVLCSELD